MSSSFLNVMKLHLPAYMKRFLLASGFDSPESIKQIHWTSTKDCFNISSIEQFLERLCATMPAEEKTKFTHRVFWPSNCHSTSFSPGHLVILENFQRRFCSPKESSPSPVHMQSELTPSAASNMIHDSQSSSESDCEESFSAKCLDEGTKSQKQEDNLAYNNGNSDKSPNLKRRRRTRKRKRNSSVIEPVARVTVSSQPAPVRPVMAPTSGTNGSGSQLATKKRVVFNSDGEESSVTYMEHNKALNYSRKSMKKQGSVSINPIVSSWDQKSTTSQSEVPEFVLTNTSHLIVNNSESLNKYQNQTPIDLHKSHNKETDDVDKKRSSNELEMEQSNTEIADTADDLAEEVDYTEYPSINGLPSQGDIIAFKVLEMNTISYEPEVSDFKTASVVSVEPKSKRVLLDIQSSHLTTRPEDGKFEVHIEDEDTLMSTLEDNPRQLYVWSNLQDVRLVEAAPEKAN